MNQMKAGQTNQPHDGTGFHGRRLAILGVILLAIGFLAVAIPAFVKARKTTARNYLMEELRQKQLADDRAYLKGKQERDLGRRRTELAASHAQDDTSQDADASRQRDMDLTLTGLAAGLPAGVLTNASAWLAYTNGLSPDRLIKAEEIKRNYVAMTLALQAFDEAQRRWQQEHGTAQPRSGGDGQTNDESVIQNAAEVILGGKNFGQISTPTEEAFWRLYATTDAVSRFEGMIKQATSPGQAYCLLGIFYLDKTRYQTLSEQVSTSTGRVELIRACRHTPTDLATFTQMLEHHLFDRYVGRRKADAGQSSLTVEVCGDGWRRIYSNGAPAVVEGLSLRFALNGEAFSSGDELAVSCVISNYSAEPISVPGTIFDETCTFWYRGTTHGVDCRLPVPSPPIPSPVIIREGKTFTITQTYKVPAGCDHAGWLEHERDLGERRNELATRLALSNVTPREVSRVIDKCYPTNQPAVFDFDANLVIPTTMATRTNDVCVFPHWRGIPIRMESQNPQAERTRE